MKYLKMSAYILLYFAIYLVMQIISGLIVGITGGITMISKYGLAGYRSHINDFIANSTFIIVVIGAIFSFLIYILLFKNNKEGDLFQRCRFDKIEISDAVKIIITGIGLSFLCSAFIVLTQEIFVDYSKVSNQISSGEQNVFGMISAVVLIPVFEEILFRGLIFNELRKNLNLILSVIIQALIFAAAHGNIAQGIYTFCLGAAAALVYTWTKSILADITLHITFNLCGSILVPVLSSYIDSFLKGQLIGEYVVIGIYFVIGTLAVIFSLISLYKRCNFLART